MKAIPSKSWHYPLVTLSSLAGCLLSLYLLVQHTQLKTGAQDQGSFCSVNQYFDCDSVTASQYSEVLGIPLGAWGAVYYFGLLLLCLLARPQNPGFSYFQRWVLRLAVVGLLADVGLLAVQALSLGAFCLLCLGTYVLTLAIFYASLKGLGGSLGNLFSTLRSTESPPQEAGGRYLLAALALVSFVGLVGLLPANIRIKSQTYAFVENALGQFFQRWSETPSKDIPSGSETPLWGNQGASIKITEFSDFQCPFCRKGAFALHTALSPLKDRVSFAFRHFPLDSECNPAVTMKMHPNACKLARLAVCANRQNAFWEFHDLVFLSLDEKIVNGDWAGLRTHLQKALPGDAIDKCLADASSLAVVQADIKQANDLGIRSTPSVLINGKAVTIPLTVEHLQRLIRLESKRQP